MYQNPISLLRSLKLIFQILGTEKSKLPLFLILFIFLGIIDLIGLGLFGPLISYFFSSERENNIFLNLPFLINFKENVKFILLISSVTILFILRFIFGLNFKYL